MLELASGVLDNEMGALSGRGTKFWLEIKTDSTSVLPHNSFQTSLAPCGVGHMARYEYHLLDLLENKFDKARVVSDVKPPSRNS